MLSRRNIRVKVMQTLYSIESMNKETRPGEPLQILKENLENAQQLFTFLVYYIFEVARYSEKDALQKSQKYLPTENDLRVNTKIAGNELMWTILVENEDFLSEVEEKFIHWDDDAEMMIVLMEKLFHKPSSFNFGQMVGEEKMQFATELLKTVIEKDKYCLELIKPKLKNWDSERIAKCIALGANGVGIGTGFLLIIPLHLEKKLHDTMVGCGSIGRFRFFLQYPER